MQLLLCAATAAEIEPSVAVWKQAANKKVDCLITGVGLMATTWSLQQQLHQKKYDYVLQAGVAGSFDSQLAPGAVAVVGKDGVGDEGVWEEGRFKSLSQLGLRSDAPPYSNGWLHNPDPVLERFGLPAVAATTVNNISTDEAMIRHLTHMGARLESMEGAALHFVCLQMGVPFLQLRAVSNAVGERNKKHWNMPAAINSLNTALLRIINTLLHEQD